MAASNGFSSNYQSFSPGERLKPDMVISIVTGPLLIGILGAHTAYEGLIQLGLASEELFRGERLPTLNLASVAADAPHPE